MQAANGPIGGNRRTVQHDRRPVFADDGVTLELGPELEQDHLEPGRCRQTHPVDQQPTRLGQPRRDELDDVRCSVPIQVGGSHPVESARFVGKAHTRAVRRKDVPSDFRWVADLQHRERPERGAAAADPRVRQTLDLRGETAERRRALTGHLGHRCRPRCRPRVGEAVSHRAQCREGQADNEEDDGDRPEDRDPPKTDRLV